MATKTPVQVTGAWSEIQVGSWQGAIQNVGNAPLVGNVVVTEDGAPDADAGGFSIGSTETLPISIGANETLYVRACGDAGVVVLA